MVTFCLDLQQAGNLHRRTQEDGVKHLFPRVLWKLPSLGQSAHQIGEAKHLVEISLEAVPGQTWRSFFSLRDRKSTRLNSSHRCISYAVFCLKKKKKYNH